MCRETQPLGLSKTSSRFLTPHLLAFDEFRPPNQSLLRKTAKGDPRLAAPEESPTTPFLVLRPSHKPGTVILVIGGPVARTGIPRLCERVRVLLERSYADHVVFDVGALIDPDAVTVDALARLQLTARRFGCPIRLHNACDRLRELLALTGLSDVVPIAPGLPLESRGKAEEREPARGVQEKADPGEPIA
jgi:ABC-type transporter Mla MlaB component